MKARETMGIKPTIDVRHHIDHFGLADSLGFAFVVKGNEDGSGGDGSGGAGADAGGGAAFDDALLATTIVPTATEELPMSMGDSTRDFAVRAQQAGQRAAAAGVTRTDNEADKLGYTRPTRRRSARSMLGG